MLGSRHKHNGLTMALTENNLHQTLTWQLKIHEKPRFWKWNSCGNTRLVTTSEEKVLVIVIDGEICSDSSPLPVSTPFCHVAYFRTTEYKRTWERIFMAEYKSCHEWACLLLLSAITMRTCSGWPASRWEKRGADPSWPTHLSQGHLESAVS